MINETTPTRAFNIGEQSFQVVEGLSPKGKTYKAMFTHVRRRNALYMSVTVVPPEGEHMRWEKLIELRRELHTRAMKGERHNVYVANEAKESFIHLGTHLYFPEEFLRAAWQRTSDDRVAAIYQCFESRSEKPDKKEPEQDLFS